MKKCKIYDNVYDSSVTLYINGTVKDIEVDFKKCTGDEINLETFYGCQGFFTVFIKPNILLLYVRKFNGKIEEYGTLMHELRHYIDWVMYTRPIKRRKEDNTPEAPAYFTEYIVNKVLKEIRKK